MASLLNLIYNILQHSLSFPINITIRFEHIPNLTFQICTIPHLPSVNQHPQLFDCHHHYPSKLRSELSDFLSSHIQLPNSVATT